MLILPSSVGDVKRLRFSFRTLVSWERLCVCMETVPSTHL